MGRVVHLALRVAVLRIGGVDAEVRRADPAAVHRLRTTTRRLRSELHALSGLVDEPWCAQLDGELKWLAARLGAVRDFDILLARLKTRSGESKTVDDPKALEPLFESLQTRRAQAVRALGDALRSERYRGFIAQLEASADKPMLAEMAGEPCRTALPLVAAKSWSRLKKLGRDLRPSDDDEPFHELRKRAKRSRYTAELVAPILGRRTASAAARYVTLLIEIQDTLGEHHDAVVSVALLERAIAEHPDNRPLARAAREILEAERTCAVKARTAFFKVWAKLDRKKSRRWVKIASRTKARA